MENNTEVRELTIDTNIIFDIINSQAGTVDKAISELVMNAIDAGAKRIDIELFDDSFSIEDDGKGFTSKKEIVEWFEKFGTKHVEGDAKYGRYRMGRGQAFSFAATKWRSGEFLMDVDIKSRGLKYTLETFDERKNGCRIDGVFYKPLSKMNSHGVSDFAVVRTTSFEEALSRVISNIKSMILYVGVDVWINGQQVNKNPEKQKWTHEDAFSYYRLEFRGMHMENLSIYNMGVFVCSIPSSVAGCHGVIVSKRALKVNFARNDILREVCPIFDIIMDEVRSKVVEHFKNVSLKTEDEKMFFVKRAMTGVISTEDLMEAQIFTDIRGYHCNLLHIFNEWEGHVALVEMDQPKAPGEMLMRSRKGFVFSSQNLVRFGSPDLEDFYFKLNKIFGEEIVEELMFLNYETCIEEYEGFSVEIPNEELTVKELFALKSISRQNAKLVALVNKNNASRIYRNKRKLHAGESDTANAWTDSISNIYINRNLLGSMGDGGY